ncbi:serine hydrolase [Streptomyces chryseus]
MAGESPDRSEQRKSSGETAPGERDPRLAVFRESAGRAEPADSGRVDQPTAVFKLPREESPTAPEAAPEPAQAPEDRASEAPEGDARLRRAVAAWVATADTPEAPDDAPGSDGSAKAAEGRSGDARAAAAAEAPADAPAPQKTSQDAPTATTALMDTPATADEADASGTDTGAGDAGEPPADAAGAGWSEHAVELSGTDVKTAGAPADEAAPEPQATTTTAATATDTGARASDVEADAEAGEASGSDGADGDELSASGTDHPDDSPGAADDDAEPDPADADANAADAVEDRSATADAKGDAKPGGGQDDEGDGKGDGKGRGEDAPAAGAVARDGSKGGGSAPSGGAEPREGSGARDAAATGAGVDQATAVFKAVRPRQAVDQQTTALKAVGTPESAAERTSQFVPLKRDDVRPPAGRPRSITPAAPAAAAPAAATPAATAGPVPEAERTRQQPLPPKPPLDLLAELTNTPPPPETPVRTAVRRVKIWAPLVLLVVIVFAVVQFMRPLPAPTLALTAKPTYTFDGDALSMPWPEEGQSAVEVPGVGTIGTHGEQKPAPIASVAKTMTAYVILKEHPLKGAENGPKITVDAQAEKESKHKDESTASIREGQQFTERQMLQLLMVPSGNNAARLLARWGAKSEEEFVGKMNDAAKDLGMKNTTYTDPSGLEATTVSTATDQLKLAKAVMANDVFREIVNLPEVEIPGIDGKIYNNNNILLQPGVSGIKTGSSTPAGGNLLWAANTVVDGKERRIVGAVMGQEDATTLDGKLQLAISRSLKLIQAAQKDVTSATVVKKGDVVGYVDDGLGGQTPVVATKDLKAVGWPGLKVELAISDAGKPLPHTAKAGDEVGQVTVGSGPGQVTAPVELQKDLVEPGLGDKLTRIG